MPDQIATEKTVFKDLFSIFEIFAWIYYWSSCVLPHTSKKKTIKMKAIKLKGKGTEKKKRK